MSTTADKENARVLEILQRLSSSLVNLNDKESAPKLSHWRKPTSDVDIAYAMMSQGGQLLHGTSTKFTLVGKIDMDEGSKLAKDILKGCELVVTGAMILCNDDMGCARSTRYFAKHSARSVLNVCEQLVECFVSGDWTKSENAAAVKTGAVWSSCDQLEKIPRGNRNSMRRDLLTWVMECNETMEEFQVLLNKGPAKEGGEESTWDDFMDGMSEQYSSSELPIVQACLAVIKCSRGTLNVCIQACESVGEHLGTENEEDLLAFIGKLHNLARLVGEGMTDLGTMMYPPLELEDVDKEGQHLSRQVMIQQDSLLVLHTLILDSCPIALTEAVMEMTAKLKAASKTRVGEAISSISQILQK
jgi:Grap2 and cyclin-D-interacting